MSRPDTLSTPAPSRSVSRGSSVNSETPLKQNMSSTNVFIKGNLEEQKKAVRRDLGPVPEVTVDFMLKYIIPDSKVDVLATMASLKKRRFWSESDGWSDFCGKTPQELGKRKSDAASKDSRPSRSNKEMNVFLKLKAVYDKIVSYAKFRESSARSPTLSFEQYPNTAPISDTSVRTRPDGCGMLRAEQPIHSLNACRQLPYRQNWFDIACVEEYKLDEKSNDINDNIWKILWSLHHIMHVDHRRRFTFGLTIANRSTRIWFCCRQIVLVSQAFDFSKEAPKLVHLIASLAYANTTQLGYDPTMTLRWRLDSWQYDIQLTSQNPDGTLYTQTYKTTRVICNSANNIRGRATRVYEVTVDHPTDPFQEDKFVLKDSWIDASRSKEGDTLAKLLEGATSEEKELFLTVVQHAVVQVDGQDDSTEDLILRGQTFNDPRVKEKTQPLETADHPLFVNRFKRMGLKPPPGDVQEAEPSSNETPPKPEIPLFELYQYSPTPIPTSSSRSGKSQTSTSTFSRSRTADALSHHTHRVFQKHIIYSPKVHYRIVFKEVANSLMVIADSGTLRTPTVDQALRDTILALRFMAKRGYIHRDVSAGNILMYKGRAKLSDLEFAKEYGAGQSSYVRTGTYSFMAGEVIRGQYTHQPAFKGFAHNPIHDLESLWWVGVWCMMWHYPVSDSLELEPSQKEHIVQMTNYGKELFPTYHDLIDDTRIQEVDSDTIYRKRGMSGYPLPIAAMLVRLNDFRQCIAWAHRKTQMQLPRAASYFTDVLLVADPVDTLTDDENLEPFRTRLPVYEMITAKLREPVEGHDIPNTLLWPLESIDSHSDWLKTKAHPGPRTHAHGILNMDAQESYFDN